ncbi:hypothetical protein TOPH_03877 [Tolypocladium ophioglossoides CBS 100239]|uniref:FAD dependent oxidoreductase domain-containing protein n=1 Tax=Tolypocladium ophioglossoides (strain CBS 100239) TaxID=1163406 RepID=A0A0L0NC05_TOLOC|nr:hypothetical protein TOPH_03877 [Tolypocladium ophioglossoides CBS 100239]
MGAVISRIRDGVSDVVGAIKMLSSLIGKYQQLLERASSPPGLPVSNPSSSYWLDDPPFPHLADVQGELPGTADVVIVGSGITGAAAAKAILELSTHGEQQPLRVIVLEARELCSGATGRNGGHIKCVPHEEFARLKRKLGPEKARRIVRFQLRHLPALLEVGREIPQGEAREVETVDLFLEDKVFETARQTVEEMREWMPEIEVTALKGEEVQDKIGVNERVVGALSYKAGALWPFRLITGVWDDLVKRYHNLTIRTNTPVEAITVDHSLPHPFQVHSARGAINARHVFHATNGFAPHLVPCLRGRLTGVLGHMTAQRPGIHFPQSHGKRSWSIIYNQCFDYVTQRPDGEDGTPGDVMLGGGLFNSKEQGLDQIGVWDDSRMDAWPLMHIRGSLQTVFEPRWGAEGGLKKAWTGIMGFTGDMMPFVGRLPATKEDRPMDEGSGQWIAAGFNGDGMVWAWLCGTAAGVMVLGKEDEDLEVGNGRPGGKLAEWFPREEVAVDEARLKRAALKTLAGEVM